MTTHTPGPWTTSEHASGLHVTTPIRGRGIAGDEIVATLPTCGGFTDGTTFQIDRARANARLIAAAPDALRIVQRVAGFALGGIDDALILDARALLARIEGKG